MMGNMEMERRYGSLCYVWCKGADKKEKTEKDWRCQRRTEKW